MIFFIKTLSAGYNYAITTISNNKECNDDINDKNILQIAKQNMRDAAAKQLARDEARMQQAYAVGGETYIPLKRVEPGGQAKSLNDVWQNSLSGLINPTYGGNLPLAAWSTVGDLIDCGMQQVAHQISTVEGGSQTLAVVGYIPNKLIATVKDFSKDIAKKYLPKEYYQNLSEFYHGLPDNTKVTLNLFTDGLILQGAGSALKVGLTSPVPAAIQYIPHKPGISTTPSAMLAFEEKMLAIEGGSLTALGENVLTKPIPLEIKPTPSSVVPKVEQKLPVVDKVELVKEPKIIPESAKNYEKFGFNTTESEAWTHYVEFKGKKVYQRNDLIDINKLDPKSGVTNLDLMKRGYAPKGSDGKSMNLHHLGQREDGAIAEMSETFHQQNTKIIHIDGNKVKTEIDRDTFGAWRRNYWKKRAEDF